MTTKRVDELRRGDRIVLTDIENGKRHVATITYVGLRERETVRAKRGDARVTAWAVFYTSTVGGERGQLFAAADRLELP